jgi:hypothetical protein
MSNDEVNAAAEKDAKAYAKTGKVANPKDAKKGETPEEPQGDKLSGSDFDRDGSEDDNDKSDDVEISDANSGPIDREDIMDMLKNDSEVVDKMGDDAYWDGMDLVSSKYDDDTIASIPDDANMTLADLKKQIMDYEPEDDGDDEPTHAEIMQHIEDEGYGGDAIGPDGNPTPEAYEDAKQELMYQKQNETKVINGKKYRAVKESNTKSIDGKELMNFLMKRFKYSKKQAIATMKKHNMDLSFLKEGESESNPRTFKEIYDRTFRSLK